MAALQQLIQGWYCTDCGGSRTVGCCSHVTAILWHLDVNKAIIDATYQSLAASRLINNICDGIIYKNIDGTSGEDSDMIYTLSTYRNSSNDDSTSAFNWYFNSSIFIVY